jgi:hypothetical protein
MNCCGVTDATLLLQAVNYVNPNYVFLLSIFLKETHEFQVKVHVYVGFTSDITRINFVETSFR